MFRKSGYVDHRVEHVQDRGSRHDWTVGDLRRLPAGRPCRSPSGWRAPSRATAGSSWSDVFAGNERPRRRGQQAAGGRLLPAQPRLRDALPAHRRARSSTWRGLFEKLSVKIGVVMLVLGVMHFFNVYVFNAIRRRSRAEALRTPPVAPQGWTSDRRRLPRDADAAHRPLRRRLPAVPAVPRTGWRSSRAWCRWTWCRPGRPRHGGGSRTLDHRRTLQEITVVGGRRGGVDPGARLGDVPVGDPPPTAALAERLARPHLAAARPRPRRRPAAGLRRMLHQHATGRRASEGATTPDDCAGTCAPYPQG